MLLKNTNEVITSKLNISSSFCVSVNKVESSTGLCNISLYDTCRKTISFGLLSAQIFGQHVLSRLSLHFSALSSASYALTIILMWNNAKRMIKKTIKYLFITFLDLTWLLHFIQFQYFNKFQIVTNTLSFSQQICRQQFYVMFVLFRNSSGEFISI